MTVYSFTAKMFALHSIFGALALSGIAQAEEAQNISDALTKGKAYLDLRYRYEFVDQDGFAEHANASTLRTRLGYQTGTFKGISGLLEFENVTAIASGKFNNTVNGENYYPVVADPKNTEVNQVYLTYKGINGFTLTGGRQALNLDNQRFVGTVGWRQNDQAFDALRLVNTPVAGVTLAYTYVWNVNRIFGEDHPLGDLAADSHFFNISYDGLQFGKLTVYDYLLGFDNVAVQGLNSNTIGARFAGSTGLGEATKLHYALEYANQTDRAGNPGDYSAHYFLGEAGVGFDGLTVKAGYEVLGSDNGVTAFQTPLATLHKFNGWADKFLTTPVAGLRDFYLTINYTLMATETIVDGLKLAAVYHKFEADFGGAKYGSELGLSASKKIFDHYSLGLKFARYDADSYSVDTSKFWLTVGARF
ncbi:alginate export family protein [Emcibacter sp.]|uniref:alginate export family protein n=1 Tax=Emcibacter sp. TaxID=1979954 RepID=UPI002AA91183|nr:alginate export family protein [Emcibacter sp.]